MNGHDINGTWRQIFVAVLIALCSGSMGFGVSQITVVRDVAQAKSDIGYLQKGDVEERQRADARVNMLADLMKEQLKLNTELIGLVKVQNELLSRERK
jgi:hypothetical protein